MADKAHSLLGEQSDWQGVGARLVSDIVQFRVWAPGHERVDVVLYRKDGSSPLGSFRLQAGEGGYYSGSFEGLPRLVYRYRLDGGSTFADPASRSQPFGVRGPSEAQGQLFCWTDADWKGVALENAVIYEAHVGTATPEGTFEGLAERLPALKDLGITVLELMPVASFPGRRNWGYDGVFLFAPHHGYGGGFGLRRLIDTAHRHGIAVILDVVYSHLGPDGNDLRAFSPAWYSARRTTPWGATFDVSQPAVRHFFLENAAMWIGDYHLDGLRLDAVHALADDEEPLFVKQLADRARAAGGARQVLVIAEDERNERRLVLPPGKENGLGLDGVWADDLHHQLRRALGGDKEGYYRDYTGRAADIATTLKQGWFYTGQRSTHLDRPRGTRAIGIEPSRFVHCLENHDQIGNRALGDRLGMSVSSEGIRAATALLLLAPSTPLLFMGQEWNASTPFLYFTDHEAELGRAVRDGRREEFKAFSAWSGFPVPNPQDMGTFERSILRWDERSLAGHAEMLAWHKALLTLRATHPVLRSGAHADMEVTPLGDHALVMHRKGSGSSEVFIFVNLQGPLSHMLPGPLRLILDSNERRFIGRVEASPKGDQVSQVGLASEVEQASKVEQASQGGQASEVGPGFRDGLIEMRGPGAVVLERLR